MKFKKLENESFCSNFETLLMYFSYGCIVSKVYLGSLGTFWGLTLE